MIKNNSKDELFATLLMLLLVSVIIVPLFVSSVVRAHDPPWAVPTYAYVTVSPTTVGVGQYTLVVMWLDKYPPTAGGLGGDRWRGWTLTVMRPDGTNETIPYEEEVSAIASAFMTYTPDQVGDYQFIFSWPGQTLTTGTGIPDNAGLPYVGDFFEGATSEPAILHVQKDPIVAWAEPPIPTDYWSRPISTANRDWTVIASNWLRGSWQRYNNFQEYGRAPNSAHIVWTKPIINGGISDRYYDAIAMDTTDYENAFPAPIIMMGRVYYNAGTYPNYGYYCVDLRTGEPIWYKNGTDNGLNNPVTYYDNGGGGNLGPWLAQNFPELSFGQLYHYYSVNGEGVKDHLWMTQTNDPQNRWYMLDANTGNWVLTLKNVPSGMSVTDQDGSILLYSYNTNTGRFLAWNTSQSIPPSSPTGTGQQQWEPRTGATIDAVNDTSWTEYGPNPGGSASGWSESDILPRSGYTMNVTGPTGLPSLSRVLQDEARVPQQMFFSDFYNNPSFGSGRDVFRVALVNIDYHVVPFSPFPDKTPTQNNNHGYGVTLVYDKTIQKPRSGNLTFSLGPISYEDKVFTIWSKETRQWWGYSLENGALLWGPTEPQPVFDMYGQGSLYAYGKLYSGYLGGTVFAYDMKTGVQVWNYTASGIGHESPYGDYDVGYGGKYASDGKIFIRSFEHSPSQPMWRGSYLRAVNATTGDEIWKIQNMVLGLAIADGYIVAASEYDDLIYCFGKGPSSIKVETPLTSITAGNQVVIRGTITDQSAGAKQIAKLRGFEIPAISDPDQQAYMEYLYQQQAYPTNATGVPVTLSAIDPNGNLIDIGQTTSDLYGTFGFTWDAPNVPGTYQIIAKFAGSESYYSSQASTYTSISDGTTTPQPTQSDPSMTDTYILGFGIASLMAIIVVGIAILLMLRRRP
jgi:hypothetical protein